MHRKRTIGWQWTFASLFVSVSVALIGIGIIAPILPLYADEMSAKGVSIGLVFAAFSVSRTLFAPVVGRLSDRIGRRRLLVIGLCGFTAVSFLYIAASTLWMLGFLRFLQGAASVMVTPIAQAYVGDITPKGREGRLMNVFYTAMFAGVGLGPLLGGWISEVWSYEAAFAAMGVLSLCALGLVVAFVPADHGEAHKAERIPKEGMPSVIRLLRDRSVKGIAVYFATRGIWRQGFNAFYPLFATATAGLSKGAVGTVLTAYFLAGGILQIPFGFVADRIPRYPQVLIGSFGAPILLLFVPWVHGFVGICLLMLGVGAFSAFSRAAVLAIRTELGRTHGMGTVTGLQGSAFSAGQTVGPLAAGLISDGFGTSAVFPFGSAVGILGSVLVMRWLRPDPHPRRR